MSRAVLITVRVHDGRYHGMRDGPPSPARLFQALVAGAGLSGSTCLAKFEAALEWLEKRRPPLIAAPITANGQIFRNYVPNNGLDAVGGDVRRIGSIRTVKVVRPLVFDAGIPFLYGWTFDEDEESKSHAETLCALAERLYQFGRTVDMAWAGGEVLGDEELDARLSNYPGLVFRPSNSGSGRTLACPQPGSLQSLKDRYAASSQRFKTEKQGRVAKQRFSQPPKPRFGQVAYDSSPSLRVYELRDSTSGTSIWVWPLARASSLVVALRDGAVDRLRSAFPDRISEIERVLVGRKANGADDGPTSLRVRIVPLPSIGHHHADRGIRRVLVEVPAGGPLRADDVHWAFSGLDLNVPESGDAVDLVLTPAADETMLAHYGTTGHVGFRVWRTVTPVALPDPSRRRRIDPTRVMAEAKDGAERAGEMARAAAAVAQALRHAGIRTRSDAIRVQREPFEANGERVEAFAPGTRFVKERLWHVEITFNAPLEGPLVIGDGRFLGLGIMAPVQRTQGVHAFMVEGGLTATPQPTEVARALRRAVMSRVQAVLGDAVLPTFFTGHEKDGLSAQSERCPHLTFAFEPTSGRLFIISPHVRDRREASSEELRYLRALDEALTDFYDLRAGPSGRLILRATSIDVDTDPLFVASRTWQTVTPYVVTRHMKHVGVAEALSIDLRAQCRRLRLPEPKVLPRQAHGVAGIGLVGDACLTFKVAVKGPIILGRNRHLGGGLFEAKTID
jgi:CRISPR-associated protein Csb2